MYASVEDLKTRWGEDEYLLLSDPDNDGVTSETIINQALTDATDEINGYVAKKYDLPLSENPNVLKRICVDIAVYRLSAEAQYTEEKRKRYEDAISYLNKLSRGDVVLTFTNQLSNNGELSEETTAASDVELDSSPRLFKRASLGKIL